MHIALKLFFCVLLATFIDGSLANRDELQQELQTRCKPVSEEQLDDYFGDSFNATEVAGPGPKDFYLCTSDSRAVMVVHCTYVILTEKRVVFVVGALYREVNHWDLPAGSIFARLVVWVVSLLKSSDQN